MSDLDTAIRARLEAVRSNMTAHHAVQQAEHGDGRVDAVWNDAGELALAIRDLLDWATGLEKDFTGYPSNVGKAFAEQARKVIADSLGVSGVSEPTTPTPRVWRDGDPEPGQAEVGLKVTDRWGRIFKLERWTTTSGWWCHHLAEIPEDGSLPGGWRWGSFVGSCGPVTEVVTPEDPA